MNKNKFKKTKLKVLEFLMMKDVNARNKGIEQIIDLYKSLYQTYTIRNDKCSEMWVYKDGIYIPNGKSFIIEFYRKLMEHNYDNKILTQVIERIEADTMIEQEEFFNNNIPYKIPVENGTLNLKTFELEKSNESEIHFNKLYITYDKNIDCVEIKKFLSEILTEQDILILQEFLGFCLIKYYNYEKALILLGGGSNGKSVLLDLIKRFIGAKNTTARGIGDFDKNDDKFKLCGLHNKMLNIAGDVSAKSLSDSSVFKQLTGGDLITANRKFLQPIHFVNYSKFISSFNQLPMTYDLSDGFFRRWLIIEFKTIFKLKQEYEKLDNDDKKNYKLADINIMKKLDTKEEMSGLLNFAIDGLKRLNDNKGFSNNDSIETIKNEWLLKSNSFEVYFQDNIICDNSTINDVIEKQQLKKKYLIYCRENELKFVSDRVIKHTLEIKGIVDKRVTLNNEQKYVWEGLKLKTKTNW